MKPETKTDHHTKKDMNTKEHHVSRTGVRGDPKKEGAGGKGTWGSSMENSGPAAIDSKDPNYDSDADKAEPQKS
eukprot:CAMPEP_0185844866 /NCGR_PEP_ID=MMETSP1354-20130828/966_1 /TAXON_ID=708628 /ORGANISM="Erythrolobus madagascarensis, Strain CCMP3276" /LENGTH=73 /DNA_ID=CAMNT_0028544669 /DNA_START=65 /DNA_END=286 /DNA_ORIENTATION=-